MFFLGIDMGEGKVKFGDLADILFGGILLKLLYHISGIH